MAFVFCFSLPDFIPAMVKTSPLGFSPLLLSPSSMSAEMGSASSFYLDKQTFPPKSSLHATHREVEFNKC